jgi:UDP-N-acetylmuramoyl-L-alanyl-D-glutamate--2,6-diaminopimelate ligase
VSGVTLDSRQVRPGDLYAALPGGSTHGARFAAQAAQAGAVAALTDPQGAAEVSAAGLPALVVEHPGRSSATWPHGSTGSPGRR